MTSIPDKVAQYVNETDIDDLYTVRDVADAIDEEFSTVRYHLNRLVKKGVLMKLKYTNIIYYMNVNWYMVFKEFKNTGVEIE